MASVARIQIAPFTAARLARASEADRLKALVGIGVRHLKRNRLMRWDGSDIGRGLALADQAYRAALV